MKQHNIAHSRNLKPLTQLLFSVTLLFALQTITAQANDNSLSRSEQRQERHSRFHRLRKKLSKPRAHKHFLKSTDQEYTDDEQVEFSEVQEYVKTYPLPKDFGTSHKNKYEPQEIEIQQGFAGPRSAWGNIVWGLLQWTGGIVHNSNKFQAIGSKAHQDTLDTLRARQLEQVGQSEFAPCDSTGALTAPTDIHPLQSIKNAIGIGVGGSFGHSETDYTPPPVELPTPTTPSEWSTFKEEIRLDKDRLIVVDAVAGETPSLTISDNLGPSPYSHSYEWGLEHDNIKGKPHDPQKKGWDEFARKPQSRNSAVYGKPITIKLVPDSLDGWENIDLLRTETADLSFQVLEEFVRTHYDILENAFNAGKEKLKTEPENRILESQVRHLKPYLYPPALQDCSGESDTLAKASCEGMNLFTDRNVIRREHSERNSLLREGKYVPPIPIVSHYTAPLDAPLIVTHPNWAQSKEQVKAMDDLISAAKKAGRPVVYLIDGSGTHDRTAGSPPTGDPSFNGTPLQDRNPTAGIYSSLGENWIMNSRSDVTIVGSLWGQCHLESINYAIANHFFLREEPITVHLPMSAINGATDDNTLEDTHKIWGDDSFYKDIILKDLFRAYYDQKPNPLDRSKPEYQYNISIDDKQYPPIGNGTKVINIKFWTMAKFLNDVLPNIRSPFKRNF